MNDRYSRQIIFNPIGEKGQKKLFTGRAAIIGMGGLGSVISQSLARAGVGFIRIVDMDFPDISNLQRQNLYDESDIGKNTAKVLIAKQKLEAINSEIKIEAINKRLDISNAESIIKDVDIVLDGTDNFETRLLINESCVRAKIPWIYGSVAASYGMVYNIFPGKTPCLKCIYPEILDEQFRETSVNRGILNSAVSVIASMQATEAVKYLTGNSDVLLRDLLFVDLWNLCFEFVKIKKTCGLICPVCGL
ncbi:MAG: HesA/MoeB/ThiF family protein [Actinomycetota bacterium]